MTPAYEATAARWIAPRLLPWRPRDHGHLPVGVLVPTGFAGYVRIAHRTPHREPPVGTLPPEQAAEVIGVLRGYTSTPEECRFAVWDGWGGFEPDVCWPGAVRLDVPRRSYVLLRGPVEAAASSFVPEPTWQGPSLWWPLDRAWWVATDVDLRHTFVGAEEACAAVLRDRVGAEPVDLADPVAGERTD